MSQNSFGHNLLFYNKNIQKSTAVNLWNSLENYWSNGTLLVLPRSLGPQAHANCQKFTGRLTRMEGTCTETLQRCRYEEQAFTFGNTFLTWITESLLQWKLALIQYVKQGRKNLRKLRPKTLSPRMKTKTSSQFNQEPILLFEQQKLKTPSRHRPM